MSLLVMEGFDYASDFLSIGITPNAFTSFTTAEKRFGTASFQVSGSSSNFCNGTLTKSCSTVIIGIAFKVISPITRSIFELYDAATGLKQFGLEMIAGSLKLKAVNGSGTQLGSDSTNSFVINGWNYVEVAYFVHDTLGSVTVRLQEQPVITASNVDTRNGSPTSVDQIYFYPNGFPGVTMYFDDYYVCDDQGTRNTTFLGDIRVETLVPTGAGNYSQFTPSTGSNWQNVDDTTPDDNTTYNSSSTPGQIDTFTYSNLSTTSGEIFGIKKMVYARKDNAGGRSITTIQRQGGVDYTGTTTAISDSYAYKSEIVELNPATGNEYTIADLNTDAEFGYEIVA